MEAKGFAGVGRIVGLNFRLNDKIDSVMRQLQESDPFRQNSDRMWIPIHVLDDCDPESF